MTIAKSLHNGLERLRENGIDYYGSCSKMSQVILAHVIAKDISYLHTHDNKVLDNEHIIEYNALIDRACRQEPLEYLTNKASFYSKEFFVDENVLIPRPETELLIDNVLDAIEDKNEPLSIAEIGAGSGVISIVLSQYLPSCSFIATDISSKALGVAKKNALAHNVDSISFIHTSLLGGVSASVDIVVSNPPYIQQGVKLDKNISFEPDIALFGGYRGDEILISIIDISYKKNVKILACEMGYDQKQHLKEYINTHCKYKKLVFYQDLSGYDRGFVLIF